jgi:hypothetical protein
MAADDILDLRDPEDRAIYHTRMAQEFKYLNTSELRELHHDTVGSKPARGTDRHEIIRAIADARIAKKIA